MTHKSHLTTTEVACLCGVAVWQARRAIDSLGDAVLRVGLYRAIPRELLPRVLAELRRRGYLPAEEVGCAK